MLESTADALTLAVDGTSFRVPVDDALLAEYGRALFDVLPREPRRFGHVDFAADRLAEELVRPVPLLRERLDVTPLWGVWLTHDIDFLRMSYHAISHPARLLARGQIGAAARLLREIEHARSRGTDPYWNLDEIAAVERRYGVAATYFMLEQPPVGNWWNPSAVPFRYGMYRFQEPKVAEQIRRLAAGGMEIGLHGSYGTSTDRVRLADEAQTLRAVAEVPIISARQHWLDFATWETAEGYASVDIRVASNVGFNPTGWGWRTRTAHAMRLPRVDGSGLLPLIEVPPVIMDGALQGHDWKERLERLLDCVVRYRAAVSVIWHNTVLRPGHVQLARYEWFLERICALGIPTPLGAEFAKRLPDV